jgi:UDP-glucose 4-epimerase
MRALVTGGAGFIGSHVVDRLIGDGHEVLIVDDMSSGRKSNVNSAARFVQCCITTDEAATLVTDFAPERLFHLAAQMDVRVSIDKPVFDATVNVAGTVNMVESARLGGALKKVVLASTGGAIYGDTDVFPTPETSPTRPDSAYGTAKLCAEQYLGWFSRMYGIDFAAMRFGNVYGPRQNPHGEAGVIAIFAGRLQCGQPCTIFGSGETLRDYVFVSDVVEAFVGAGLHPTATGAFNIGTAIETDVNTLYAQLARLSSQDQPPRYAAARPGESERSVLDISRAASVLGWRPTVSLADGMAAVWDHLRSAE